MIDPIAVAARPATNDDVEHLVAFDTEGTAGIADARGGRLDGLLLGRQGDVAASFRDDLADDDTHVLIGTIDDVPVGLLVHRRTELPGDERIAVISDLFVQPEARGVGVGEALLSLAIEQATAQGCTGVDARALPGDRSTKNFFESFGLVARSISVHRSLIG